MHTTAVFFSATGNSRRCAAAMAHALDQNAALLDLTQASRLAPEYRFGADELVVFCAPVYAGRLYTGAAARFGRVWGQNTPCILAVTYGNRHYDDALAELEDIARRQGFVPIGGAALVGRHTYGEIQPDRPDADDLAACADFARKAVQRFADGFACPAMPGSRPYREGGVGKHAWVPRVTDACNGCGACAQVCPEGAIDPADPRATRADRCISCFACLRTCPRGGRAMDEQAYLEFAAAFSRRLAQRRENEFFL